MCRRLVVNARITETFGRGFPRSFIISSASLSVLCLFYAYTVGSYLQVRTYPLIDRVTYYIPFDLYIVNEFVDHVIIGSLLILWLMFSIRSKIGRGMVGVFAALLAGAAAADNDLALDGIALSSLPVIVLLLIYDRYMLRKIMVTSRPHLTINYLAIIGIITGLVAFIFAVSSVIFPPEENNVNMRGHAYDVFLLLSSFSPVILLLLITCFPIKLLINFVRVKTGWQKANSDYPLDKEISITAKIIYLSLFMLFSIIIGIIPHLPTVNVDSQQVGVDTQYYAAWISEMKNSQNALDFIHQTFITLSNGDRPLSLFLIFAFQQMLITGNDNDLALTIEYLPLLLGPMLVLVVYFLTRELVANDITAMFAAFLTAVSFHLLIGIYAGFYANWLGLIFGYMSFLFLFRFLKIQNVKNLALYGVLLTLTLLSHVYTWSIFAIVMGLYLGVSLLRGRIHSNEVIANSARKKSITLLFLVLACTVAIDIGRSILTGSSGGIERDLEVSDRAGLEQFLLRWNNLTYASTTYVGGLFANFIILGLGLYWLFTSKMKENYNVFMIVFMSMGILPFLFGEWVIQTRVLYNIPFQIPAALALSYIGRQASGSVLRLVPICIWLITMSIIAVSNFYLMLPSETSPPA